MGEHAPGIRKVVGSMPSTRGNSHTYLLLLNPAAHQWIANEKRLSSHTWAKHPKTEHCNNSTPGGLHRQKQKLIKTVIPMVSTFGRVRQEIGCSKPGAKKKNSNFYKKFRVKSYNTTQT